MGNLATFQELATRYERGENAFDLTLEKWVRIRECLESAATMPHFREILEAAVIKVPLCLENQDNCALCSLHAICSRGGDHLGNSCGRFRLTVLRGSISSQNQRYLG